MFYELFKTSKQQWVMFDGHQKRLAFMPNDQLRLAQTLQYLSLLAILFYSLLQFSKFFQPMITIVLSIGFYIFLSFFYITRLTPRLPWVAFDKVDSELQDELHRHFAGERVAVRLGVMSLLGVLLLIQAFSKPVANWSNNDILTVLISAGILLEVARQGILYARYRKLMR